LKTVEAGTISQMVHPVKQIINNLRLDAKHESVTAWKDRHF